MSTLFTESDYNALAAIVFRPDHPGNATARGVVEAPNGDGRLDAGKRYAHVATKYIDGQTKWEQWQPLYHYIARAHKHAVNVARDLGVPPAFCPSFEHGALRVLEYPPGAGSEVHTDFDLFTLNLWRSVHNAGLGSTTMPVHTGELGELLGLGEAFPHQVLPLGKPQRSIVYFAIPDHSAVLPDGTTVGEWIAERIARSRVTR